jgi:acyl-CoA thioester hydrolase
MRRKNVPSPPQGAAVTKVRHNVAFYETDAMGIVHHSNYVRFLEHARVQFLSEHDRPYLEYMAEGLHVPVTRVEVSYQRACRFADPIDISCWLSWARHASLGFAYRLEVNGLFVASAESDHAITNQTGMPVRIPEHMRERIDAWLGRPALL